MYWKKFTEITMESRHDYNFWLCTPLRWDEESICADQGLICVNSSEHLNSYCWMHPVIFLQWALFARISWGFIHPVHTAVIYKCSAALWKLCRFASTDSPNPCALCTVMTSSRPTGKNSSANNQFGKVSLLSCIAAKWTQPKPHAILLAPQAGQSSKLVIVSTFFFFNLRWKTFEKG